MALSSAWLPLAFALFTLAADDAPVPDHIYGETATDQYLLVQLHDQQLQLWVYTDYAEFPGARQRQRFDASGDGVFSEDEMQHWQQQAGIFALRHTRVTVDDQVLPLRIGQTPRIDLYDFAQTGAKPVREGVLLVGELPAQPLVLDIATTWQQNRPQHVSRIMVEAKSPWRIIASEGANSDGFSLAELWRASEARRKPEGFDPTPEYHRRVYLAHGDDDLEDARLPHDNDAVFPSPESPYSQGINRLGELLFDRERAVVWWLGLMLAFAYGMGHAFAPGHGKALISAWLLGRRGTISDALVAGIAATATHTAMVFALGIAFTVVKTFSVNHLDALDRWISLAAGMVILALGLWLLHSAILRLRGIAAGHHHHHPHPHPHPHDHDHHHSHGHHHHHHRQAGLVGMLAGIAPCPAGILIVVFAAGQQAPALGLLYALVFSIGMASVLVAIAICVSLGLRLTLGSHPGIQRAMVVIPVFSASVVVVLGIWLGADAAARLGLIG
ncbi:MAG: hypothetical protein EA401_05985 [Planctomycetota bacterium]|nr:MAG: hypothetical protein EA401_05985 [Planctomycetota bacterium]